MRLPIPHRLRRRIGRRLRAGPRGGVLMYHRVCHARHDPWDLCVTPENFEAHMACLAAHRAGRRLDSFQGSAALDAKGRAIAVTFDDGYADNLLNALPALERHDVPATVFIVPARIGCGREFWWDGLCRAVFAPARLPAALDLKVDGFSAAAEVAPDAAGDEARNAAWRADAGPAETVRQALCLDLWARLLVQEPAVQDAAVEALIAWSGAGPADPASLPLTHDQLAVFARHPLITLGNHTKNHRPLDLAPPAVSRGDIVEGAEMLTAMTGADARLFCYPYGRLSSAGLGAVRASGATIACECAETVVTRWTRRLKMPRFQVVDQSGEQFLHRLRGHRLMEA